jgi:hypothetical protein
MGKNTHADGENSTALGNNTKAAGWHSTATGTGNIANGFASLVIGQYNDTIGVRETSSQTITPLFIVEMESTVVLGPTP